jgi:hypothetical protein
MPEQDNKALVASLWAVLLLVALPLAAQIRHPAGAAVAPSLDMLGSIGLAVFVLVSYRGCGRAARLLLLAALGVSAYALALMTFVLRS